MMRWFREKRSALLITPKILLFKNDSACIALSSLKDLLTYNIDRLDVFIDGFSQSFVTGSLPSVGLLDRRSAVDHKLARDYKRSNFFGGSFEKNSKSLSYQGFGFDPHRYLLECLQELYDLQLPIASVQSLIFSCASNLIPSCVSQIEAQSLLWISPYLESGYRVVFYHDDKIKYARTINSDNQDHALSHKDLLQTLSYIQNEYDVGTEDIKLFMTFFDVNAFTELKQLFQSSKVYTWDIKSYSSKQDATPDADQYAMEAWLLSYIQGSKKVANRFSTQSLLKPLIQKTNLIQKLTIVFQALCLILGIFIANSAFNLWRLKTQLYLAQRGLETQEIQIHKQKKQLKMPSQIEVLKFYAYLTSERNLTLEQDPVLLIAVLAEHLTPEILIREILWQREPKATLKLSFNCPNLTEEDKKEVLNEFKDKLLESLKRQSKVNISVHQPSTETMEINLS